MMTARPTQTKTPYGTYIHGIPVYRERSYERTDAYVSDRHPQVNGPQRVACASGTDDSPIYQMPYRSACPCCWLGHAHTIAYHEAALRKQTT